MLDRLAVGADEVDGADGDAGLTGHFQCRFSEHLSQCHIEATEPVDRAGPWVRCGEDCLSHTGGKRKGVEGLEADAG